MHVRIALVIVAPLRPCGRSASGGPGLFASEHLPSRKRHSQPFPRSFRPKTTYA